MIDLDLWEAKQKRVTKLDAEMASWRLSQRYGWGIPHPAWISVRRMQQQFTEAFAALGKALHHSSEMMQRGRRHG